MANAVHEKFMRETIELARNGAGRVSPNPMVGCVIVKNGRVVAKGFHKKFGKEHAEAIALKQAGAQAKGATLYVNLEPCVMHEGKKTPSCAEAIARAGIKKVFASMRDPLPIVRGKGFELLRKLGVEVSNGVLEHEAQALNEAYAKFVATRRPFVALKMALSLDGRIASAKTKRISNEFAARYVQELRNQYDAILVGVGTIVKDNPRLTCRLRGGRNPVRVIIDSQLRSPLHARVFADENAIVLTTANASETKKRALEKKGVRVFEASCTEPSWKFGVGDDAAPRRVVRKAPRLQLGSVYSRRVDLRKALKKLGELGIASVLCEGGSEIATAMLKQELADKCIFIIAPKILARGVLMVGEGVGREMILNNVNVRVLGDNAVIEGYL